MSKAFEIASVGLVAQQKALDVIANNISNLNTTAFKRTDVQFAEMMATKAAGEASTVADANGIGVRARSVMSLDLQGEIQQTGNAMDLAIEGAGFLELMGPHGQTLLSRGGKLSIAPDGQLSLGDGLQLRSAVSVQAGATDLTIDPTGRVTSKLQDGQTTEIGQINLVQVHDQSALERIDGGLYRVTSDARLSDLSPGDDGAGLLRQGAVERSNVDMNDEMVRLMIVQRAYAANAQVAQAADQIAAIANNLRK